MNQLSTAEQMVKPPFPDKMTFREMLTNLFNTDFLTKEELTTICDAGEMYANGCLKNANPNPSDSDAVEFLKWRENNYEYYKNDMLHCGYREKGYPNGRLHREPLTPEELHSLFKQSQK